MKTVPLISTIIVFIVFVACHATKKSVSSVSTPSPSSASTSTVTGTASQPAYHFPEPKSTSGVYPPGNEELLAIQVKYKDVTLAVLQQGHTIYTVGKCINCHGAKSIYKRDETQWKDIIDDMAVKAGISDEEKDAVYKYVLAIKATQAQ